MGTQITESRELVHFPPSHSLIDAPHIAHIVKIRFCHVYIFITCIWPDLSPADIERSSLRNYNLNYYLISLVPRRDHSGSLLYVCREFMLSIYHETLRSGMPWQWWDGGVGHHPLSSAKRFFFCNYQLGWPSSQ